MNKVILLGRLTKDPEIRYTKTTNTMVVNFSLAVSRKFVKPGEEMQAEFINIVAWDKMAEFISKHLSKGQKVAIIGRMQTRNYDDEKGIKHYVTEVIAEEIDFADSMKSKSEDTDINITEENIEEIIVDNDDLPF